MSMADPANAPAAVSTSRRKRVLPVQPRTEAKRLRTSSDEDYSPETRQKTNKVKSSKSVLDQNNHQSGNVESNKSRSRSEQGPSSSSKAVAKRSATQVTKTRRSSRGNTSCAQETEKIETSGPPKRESRGAIDTDRQKPNSHKRIADPGCLITDHSEASTSKQAKLNPKKSRGKKSAAVEETNTNNSKNNTNTEENTSQDRRRRNRSRSFAQVVAESKNCTSNNESSNHNQTFPKTSHTYPLRSQGKLSSSLLSNCRLHSPEDKNRENSALGASSSQQAKRDDLEPSRLTRSGAVVRRSTRTSKGHNVTTGSCASSSGASGSGRSSSRASRQHKVGAAASAPLTTPTSNPAAAMSTEQPDVPNNGLTGVPSTSTSTATAASASAASPVAGASATAASTAAAACTSAASPAACSNMPAPSSMLVDDTMYDEPVSENNETSGESQQRLTNKNVSPNNPFLGLLNSSQSPQPPAEYSSSGFFDGTYSPDNYNASAASQPLYNRQSSNPGASTSHQQIQPQASSSNYQPSQNDLWPEYSPMDFMDGPSNAYPDFYYYQDDAPASEEPPSPQEATQAMPTSGGPSGPGADSESDDSEVGRLQALLEARGLPPHLFNALGPRMQHLLHRSMGANSSASKAQQLLQGLQAMGDEGQQLQAVIEMCQMLVMGNEDTLAGFPIKQVVPALITLLRMEHNFDIMNHACRALTYMMEALPRSSSVVVDAVPVFLEKLQVIQCMDVAEQSLTALDMLSRRHSKAILQARGVSACLTYLDFFSINAQRNALSVTANCCLNLTSEEFQYVADSLTILANRLTQQDKKSVESVCLAFSRLVDSYQLEPARLQEIANKDLLNNLQQLLIVTPPVISTGTFITVLRMLSVMCANCPDLALTLLKQNIADTLLYLLTGSIEPNPDEVELIQRQPQELYEITALIGELMPKLPTDGIFTVDVLLERPVNVNKDVPIWQWRDDRGLWHPYGAVDSRMIEAAHMNGDDEVSLNTLGRTYTIDFHSMQQVNEDSGTSRPVQRRFTPTSTQTTPAEPVQPGSRPNSASRDARVATLREERGLAAKFIRSLFSVLYEVYSSSAGPTVRCKCLKALLRMVYYASPDLLKEVLKNQIVSSHIAGMMASNDIRIVVGALQMAEILMTKLPDVFSVHFRREGVIHQINQLADPEVPLGVSPPKSTNSSTTSFSTSMNDSQPGPSQSSSASTSFTVNGTSASTPAGTPSGSAMYTSTPEGRLGDAEGRSPSPSHARLSDVLKRKRTCKRSSGTRPKSRHEDIPMAPTLVQDLFNKAASYSSSTPTNSSRPRYSNSSSKTSSFLQSLNPARWGRNVSSSHDRNFSKDSLNSCLGKSTSNSNITAGNREKARTWIREQASKFIETYSANEISGHQHPALNVLSRLKTSIQKFPTAECGEALKDLREILMESDISPFEVNHSGLIKELLNYLANPQGAIDRSQRLRIFLNVFASCPLKENETVFPELAPQYMGALVAKLSGCVSQLEQFPVKVHDLPATSGAGRGGTSALKFFNTHQLKCNLQRHPDCTNLKQWKGGTVKIDPLALVQAIERYLVVRGYGRLRDKDSADSEDGDSDDDIDDTLAAVVISQTGSKHKLQFLIGDNVLPYNMTVYQAVKQFSGNGNDQSETDTDNETPLGNTGVWVQTHTIYYRPLREEPPVTQKPSTSSGSSHTSRKGKGASTKNASRKKGDDLWNGASSSQNGNIPAMVSPLTAFLTMTLPETVTIQDASLEVLCLLRILNAINLYWNTLYPALEYKPILPQSDFLNSKIAAKASRQLQDPLVIMTGNLPNWLQQIATACPFLFPFETRQLLFYATSFDRDRALQRLLDMSPELTSTDSQERVTPRLDRRKRTISREDILKQAEQVMQDLATSKALLEVQYENEVGTGLGPTLEFYALVSRELQRHDLELWHSNDSKEGDYVHNSSGLFPAPLSRSSKVGQLTKAKAKFRFLGKFMAKAVMDSRMLDLPFSLTFYRWLLGHEHSLSMIDLIHVAPDLYKTLRKMQEIVRERDEILMNENLSEEEKNVKVNELHYEGCPIADLGIDFVVPGHNVELVKNGRNIGVTIHNLHTFTNLAIHWVLIEGVSRQMESFREGFETVFPIQNLRMFQPDELEAVFCGSPRDAGVGWDIKTLMECCRPDHGYNADSRAIRFLFEVLSSYNRDEQRLFVQFLTGSPRLPVGGFKALSPPLTVVRKTLEPNMNPDDFLPSVMTCVNYLKLPDYSSIEVMRAKLRIAASEGQHSFHLS